jgi:hypothetical protein
MALGRAEDRRFKTQVCQQVDFYSWIAFVDDSFPWNVAHKQHVKDPGCHFCQEYSHGAKNERYKLATCSNLSAFPLSFDDLSDLLFLSSFV